MPRARVLAVELLTELVQDLLVRMGLTSSKENSLLTASLIDSMDWVANTAGTYYAYLKGWSHKASRTFRFNLVQPTLRTHT